PYNVYGGLQDNGSWFGPSQSAGGITNSDWFLSNWGDGFYSFRHPTDANIIYSESQGGNLVRYDKRDGQSKDIKPLPREGEPKYRFNWNTPIHLSPTNAERIYVGAQFLFRSEDRGNSWTRISPDLTTNDTSRQRQFQSGGLSLDNSTAENNTTIYTIAESAHDSLVIWVGTDDGNLQVTEDGGNQWKNVALNISGLPAFTWCTHIEPSPFDRHVAFVTFDGHRQGDKSTYVWMTMDLGKNWTALSSPIVKGYAHVIRQDIVNPNLLFLGTEFGLYISLDQGKSWKRFDNNLPGVAVRSLAIHPQEHALVIATHGRGIYIVDDITPLRQIDSGMLSSTLTFFDLPDAVIKMPRSGLPFGGAGNFTGENPSQSALIAYYMKSRHTFGRMRLEVFDEEGKLIKELPPGKSGGINLVELPLRLPPPKAAPTKNRMALAGSIITPALLEGSYLVRITKGKETFEHQISLQPDPKSVYTVADRKMQQKTLSSLYDMTNQLGYIYYALEDMHVGAKKVETIDQNLGRELEDFSAEVEKYKGSLVSLEGDFYVAEGEAALREEISTLYYSISTFPGRPSERQSGKAAKLQRDFLEVEEKFKSFEQDAFRINDLLQSAQLTPITWRSYADYIK
ncbi:MAG: hypothetical protein HKN76_00085, partial [Saprospiraceae bacterium]|nr:hypothetical protein [Saprospiraceae bacterium]